MSKHYSITSRTCKLCFLAIKDGCDALLVVDRDDTRYLREWSGCPRAVCPACKTGPSAFPYHPFCVAVFESAQKSGEVDNTSLATRTTNPFNHINNALRGVGRALEFTLPMGEYFVSERRYRLLEDSFSRTVLMRVPSQCNEHDCQCLTCLYRHSARLPAELLSQHILPHIAFGHIRQTIPLYGAVSDVVSLLLDYPAKDYPISCAKAIYETRVRFAGKSYITGLHNNPIPGSSLIKQNDDLPKHMVVWLDGIGVTDTAFLYSGSQVSPKPGSKWAYAVPVIDTVLVRSKGVFIERIASSTNSVCQFVWNSSATPLLLKQKPFNGIDVQQKECLMRYVPLANSTSLSVGFHSGTLFAIISHQGNPSSYTESGANITWIHCPLMLDKNEQIHQVWSVSGKDLNIGTWALIITHIASSPVRALYYSDPSTNFSYVRRPCYANKTEHAASPEFPTYKTEVPGHGLHTAEIFYSEAPLDGVVKVQSCHDRGRCTGLFLQYENYNQTVGEFRYGNGELEKFDRPCSIGLYQVQQAGTTCLCIKFSADLSSLEDGMQPMSGFIVWWYGKDVSDVKILPPEL
ncbi:hypothetical protein EJ07DRAFT_160537 [Lizonia empirigonia]|nr:hypothetical protein EJ07DRAFT_160537 [Lizonia empirigonia]